VALDLAYRKLSGARGRLFADPQPAPGEIAFQVDNTSAAYYESPYYKLHRNDLQAVPAPRTAVPRVDLADVLGATFLDDHSDSADQLSRGRRHRAAKVDSFQTARQALENEANVADAMAQDVRTAGDRTAFFFHLGMSSTTSARPVLLTTSSTSHFRLRPADLRVPAATTEWSSRQPDCPHCDLTLPAQLLRREPGSSPTQARSSAPP
jgi:hypothetical protein